MTSLLEGRPGLVGAQHPRVCSFPDYVSSAGVEAVELCRLAGLELDGWQQLVLERALGERPDGRWAAFEVGVCVPRQNGKGAILEARELAGLFILGERLIIHSAHEFATSLEAFRRLLALIEETPDLERRVKRVSRAHGEEGIELKGGQRVRFRTRTKGGGRGFSADCVILDESMMLPEASIAALMPTLSARPNPQVWYTGSAVDQESHDDGLVFARVRERGVRGDEALAYFEWSLDRLSPDEVLWEERVSSEVWAAANPGLGIRISEEHVGNEQRSMDPRTFAVERLNVGDWPAADAAAQSVISLEAWVAAADFESAPESGLWFCADVAPDRSRSTIVVCGWREDGLAHVEVVDRRPGTDWVAARVAELAGRNPGCGVVVDAVGPASSLLPPLRAAGLAPVQMSARDAADAAACLFDAVAQGTVRHLGQPELEAAVRGAAKRPLGDAWAWSRKHSKVDITPLVGASNALWAASSGQQGDSWLGW